jgi:amino acid transporter
VANVELTAPAVAGHMLPARRLKLRALICVAYFTACGGAFGIEPLVGSVGPGTAVALICLTPFIWSMPIALMAAELTTMMPVEGGYYVWVREALGPFWAVQEACWSMCYTLTLMAIFPVLFVAYLGFLFPWLGSAPDPHALFLMPLLRWAIAVLVIVTAMITNLGGARDVGRSAVVAAALVLGSFLLLIAVWFARSSNPAQPIATVMQDLSTGHPAALLLGMSTIVFNFSGWDNVSPYAGEVDRPQKNYPVAIAAALVLAVLGYLLPVLAGIGVTTDPAVWSDDAGWPVIAGLVGGRWLGMVLAAAGLVSMWGLYNAQVLFVSRLPFAMALDGWLPRIIARARKDTGVPVVAVIAVCALTIPLTALSFGSLVIIQCVTYTGALLLEFLALLVLRARRPDAHRPFRIPGGRFGLWYVCLAPLIVAAAVLTAAVHDADSYGPQLLAIALVAVSGVALYLARRGHARKCRHDPQPQRIS